MKIHTLLKLHYLVLFKNKYLLCDTTVVLDTF